MSARRGQRDGARSMTATRYDGIAPQYGRYRRADPGIALRIADALGAAGSVVNVGAGAGSYEPADRFVIAVDPSAAMLRRRARSATPALRAAAESLPFADDAFDGALAILTIHHWPDWRRGLREMRRTARRMVLILTWDPLHDGFWLLESHFPEILDIDRAIFPSLAAMEDVLGPLEAQPVPIPAHCPDGFLGAYWRRPAAYLDPGVRGAISSFARVKDVVPGLRRLETDLADGTWENRHQELLGLAELDIGYRLVISRPGPE